MHDEATSHFGSGNVDNTDKYNGFPLWTFYYQPEGESPSIKPPAFQATVQFFMQMKSTRIACRRIRSGTFALMWGELFWIGFPSGRWVVFVCPSCCPGPLIVRNFISKLLLLERMKESDILQKTGWADWVRVLQDSRQWFSSETPQYAEKHWNFFIF